MAKEVRMSEYQLSKSIGDLKSLLGILKDRIENDSFKSERNKQIVIILCNILPDPPAWDKHTEITSINYGVKFSEALGVFLQSHLHSVENNFIYLDDIFVYLLRYSLEMYMSSYDNLSFDISEIRRFAIDNQDKFSDRAKEQISHAINSLPITTLKSLLQSSKFNTIKEFTDLLNYSRASVDQISADAKDETTKSLKELDMQMDAHKKNAEKKEADWRDYIERKQREIEEIKDSLNEYKHAYNFVGLFQGFLELSEVKYREKKNSFRTLLLLGFLVLTPFLYEFYQLSTRTKELSSLYELIPLIPVFSFAFIFIYYFRIALQNHNSLKSQILQIELRKTLCQFIQSYGDYAIKMKKEDPDSLAKFENVVFANIMAESGDTPQTFDGIEQISKLISSLKK
jgi:hypothetical protein